MIGKPQLNEIQKGKIIGLREEGFTIREIATKTKIPKSTVGDFIKNYSTRNTFLRPRTNGRKKSLNNTDLKILEDKVKENPKLSAPKLTAILKEKTNKIVNPKTVKNGLKELGYKARVACKKPLLSKKNILARLSLTKEWLFYTDEYWKSVIWSDESKFNIFQSDGRCYVFRKENSRYENKNLSPTIKFGGGNVMVWGCFSFYGVGKLVFIEDKMDKLQYLHILVNNLFTSAEIFNLENFTFQQDNDPKHTAGIVKEWFIRNNIQTLKWPAQSPDLNPIEHLWAYVQNKIRDKNIKNKNQLKEEIMNAWNGIPKEICEKYVLSMRNRILAVQKAKGGHIPY